MKHYRLLLFLLLTVISHSQAQPYLDLVNVQLAYESTSSIYKGKDDGKLEWTNLSAGLNLPQEVGKYDLLLLSPQWEKKSFTQGDKAYSSLSFPLSWRHLMKDTVNTIILAAIVRYNGPSGSMMRSNNFQPAAAAIYLHNYSEKFTLKLGLYYSREFFGHYWLPLIGADWQLNDRWMIWGLLPKSAVIDYTITPGCHVGFAYKGIDESYRIEDAFNDSWMRFSQGQVKLFTDVYIKGTPLVFTAEAGHSAFTKFIAGEGFGHKGTTTNPTENVYLKAGIAVRYITMKSFRTPRTPLN